MSALSIHGVSKTFGASLVLSNLSLEIASGEFFFLLGPSGCGKSTLLRIIAGLERADSGSVAVDGHVIDTTPPQRRGIGMVFQNYALWPHMTVADNIGFGLESIGLSRREQQQRISQVLQLVRMERFEDRYPHQISGGQQQRVALARALALRPRIILLDEPLSNLDASLRHDIRRELTMLHRTLATTMIYVTHDQEDAMSMATRIAVLQQGTVAQVGTPREVYDSPRSRFVAEFMGRTNIIPCSAQRMDSEHGQITFGEGGNQQAVIRQQVPSGDTRGFVCIRPEVIQIEPLRPQREPSAFEARVVRKSFTGPAFEVELEIGAGVHITGIVPRSSATAHIAEGERVSVSWPMEQLRFLPH